MMYETSMWQIKIGIGTILRMATLTQFGSDLNAVTQASLNKVASLTKVSKQPPYAPLPIEKQIIVIYAAINGFCDRMPLTEFLNMRVIPGSIKP